MTGCSERDLKEALITGAEKILNVLQEMVDFQIAFSGKVDFQKTLDLKRKDIKECREMLEKE